MGKPSRHTTNGNAISQVSTPCRIETHTPNSAPSFTAIYRAYASNVSAFLMNGRSRRPVTFHSIAITKRGWDMQPVSYRTAQGCSRQLLPIGSWMSAAAMVPTVASWRR